MRARWHAPEIGRFASVDTIVPDPMNPQAFNRYSYRYNNPVKYTDPSGHCVEDSRDDFYDYECWQKADELYDKYGSTGLSYGALGILSLEELPGFDWLLQNAWNRIGDLQEYLVRHVWVQMIQLTNQKPLICVIRA